MNKLAKYALPAVLVASIVAPMTAEAATVRTTSAVFSAIGPEGADNFNTDAVTGVSANAYGNWGTVSAPMTPAKQSGLAWKGVSGDLDTSAGSKNSFGTLYFRNTVTNGQEKVQIRLTVDVEVQNAVTSTGTMIVDFLVTQHLNNLPASSCKSAYSAAYGCGDDIKIVSQSYVGDIDGNRAELNFTLGGASSQTYSSVEESNIALSADVKVVPLPGAIWLFGTGIAAMGAVAARRKRNQIS